MHGVQAFESGSKIRLLSTLLLSIKDTSGKLLKLFWAYMETS